MRQELDKEMNDEITVQARPDAVPRVVEFVSAFGREMAFTEARLGEIALALEEALGNIIRFACPGGSEEIRVTCRAHEMGSIALNIVDSGRPFNMLVVSTFPEVAGGTDEIPSTRIMKKAIRDVEYRRDGDGRKNILAWIISR